MSCRVTLSMLLHISVNDHVVEDIIPYRVENFSRMAIEDRAGRSGPWHYH
jgi:hypothetical protein